jgi:hypothetical protein
VWPSVEAEDLRLFPAETVPTEVTVRAGLLVDGLTKIQLLNDLSWSQVKVRLDNGEEFFLRQFRCTVIEYGDRQGFGDADRVRHLDQAPPAKTSFDQGLGDPASRVCRRPVHFGEVFSREGAAPVGAPSAVRVHDDLATGQTGIALGSPDDEQSTRIDVYNGVAIEILWWDDALDHFVQDLFSEFIQGDFLAVLHRHHDRVHPLRYAGPVFERVLAGHLRLGIRSRPPELSRSSQIGDFVIESVSQDDRQGHALFSLVSGVTEHQALPK